MANFDPSDEMRFALSQINNPYHRAMICAWMSGLEILERMEVMLSSIAMQLDPEDDFDLDDA